MFHFVMSDWASKETRLGESVTWPSQTPQGLHMNLSKSQTTVIYHFTPIEIQNLSLNLHY